jgi:tRNA threonylcarbamoyl adenosine modification protein YeaZ
MKLLGISTSSNLLSLTVTEGRRLLGDISLNERRSHAEKIITKISELLDSVKIELYSLDGIAVNLGPGSFTGLRVGLSTAKGLALGSGLNLYGYTSFEEYLYSAIWEKNAKGKVSVFIDSRKGEFYSANYRVVDKDFSLIDSFELVNLHQAMEISSFSDYTILLDSSQYLNEFRKIQEDVITIKTNSYYGCLLVQRDIWKYLVDDYGYLEPIYLKNFIPKIKK